jgi:hypothetical protein
MRLRRRDWIAAICLFDHTGTIPAQTSEPLPGKRIPVTLLGTSAGPPVRIGRTGISTLVEAGAIGSCSTQDEDSCKPKALGAADGCRVEAICFPSPFRPHPRHIRPDAHPVVSTSARREPLEVWEPQGTRAIIQHLPIGVCI